MTKPTTLDLTKDDILVALGNGKEEFVKNGEAFAKELLSDLLWLFEMKDFDVPDQEEAKQFISLINDLNKTASKLMKLAKKSIFARIAFSITARLLSEKNGTQNSKTSGNYNYFDEKDLAALAEVLSRSLNTPRFVNKKKGPDSRYAREIAIIIAERYHGHFGSLPGIGGGGKIQTKENQFYLTPFQRICDVVSSKMKVRIGRPLQEEVLLHRLAGEIVLPPFRPDVLSLPDKSKY